MTITENPSKGIGREIDRAIAHLEYHEAEATKERQLAEHHLRRAIVQEQLASAARAWLTLLEKEIPECDDHNTT